MSNTPSNRARTTAFQKDSSYLLKLADLSPNLLAVIDLREQEIIYVNEKIKELLGHNSEFVYKQGPQIFKSLLHPDDYQRRLDNLEKCKSLSDEEESTVEVRFRVGEKEWQWFRITDKVFRREEDGTVTMVMGTAQNIHEQKGWEEKLREKHRRLKNAQAIGHIGSFERDLPGDLFIYSEEFYRILGLEPQPEKRIYGGIHVSCSHRGQRKLSRCHRPHA